MPPEGDRILSYKLPLCCGGPTAFQPSVSSSSMLPTVTVVMVYGRPVAKNAGLRYHLYHRASMVVKELCVSRKSIATGADDLAPSKITGDAGKEARSADADHPLLLQAYRPISCVSSSTC